MTYEWLAGALADLMPLAREYGLEWDFDLPGPSTTAAIADAERTLGTTFPPSLRAFYLEHDGFALRQHWRCDGEARRDLADCEDGVLSVAQLVAATLDMREQADRVYDEPGGADEMIAVLRQEGGFQILDASAADDSGEYRLYWASHDVGPSMWRDCEIAPNFDRWLEHFFSEITENRMDPGTGRRLDEISHSVAHYRRRAEEATVRGDADTAWDSYLAAIDLCNGDPRTGERLIAALSEAAHWDDPHAFYLRLIRRILRTREPGRRSQGVGRASHWDSLKPSERTHRASWVAPGARCPALLEITATHTAGLSLFGDVPALQLDFHVRHDFSAFVLSANGDPEPIRNGLMPFAIDAPECPPEFRQRRVPGPWPGSPPSSPFALHFVTERSPRTWLLLEPDRPAVWRAVLVDDSRRRCDGWIFGEPAFVAANLDAFLDERLERYLRARDD